MRVRTTHIGRCHTPQISMGKVCGDARLHTKGSHFAASPSLVRPCPCPSLAQTTGRIPDSVKLNVLIRSQESEALRRHLQLNGGRMVSYEPTRKEVYDILKNRREWNTSDDSGPMPCNFLPTCASTVSRVTVKRHVVRKRREMKRRVDRKVQPTQ